MSGAKTQHILVVDDEAELRELLSDALAGQGLEVTAAASGEEAVTAARQTAPDLIVTDLQLGDCSGLDVIDRVRGEVGDLPAVVISGHGSATAFSEASRRTPVELMTKPLDLERLRGTVRRELARRQQQARARHRSRRLRKLARNTNLQRKSIHRQLETTCTDLAGAYRTLSGQMAMQQVALTFQRDLLAAKNDDDVFRSFFRVFARRSGPVYGIAMVCDAEANLQIIGRFGVPGPDNPTFCEKLCRPAVESTLAAPRVALFDAGDDNEKYDPSIRKYLAGLTVMTVPLMPAEGEMIGLVLLYRKGEQPFTDDDLALAEIISLPTAITVRRND